MADSAITASDTVVTQPSAYSTARCLAFTKLKTPRRVARVLLVEMNRTAFAVAALAVLALAPANAQSFVGTLTGIKAETAEIQIKPDTGVPVTASLTPETITQKIAPGEKDLKKAEAIKPTDLAVGDRVLATIAAGSTNLRRIIVMSVGDIAKRNEADKADWTKRGVSGVVSAHTGNEITLKYRTMSGQAAATVTVGDKTSYKRYAPDSVKFADTIAARLADVSVGDQLRARGIKSEDGTKVTADEVVFGTFLTKAGSITAVNAEANEITVKELGTNKPVVIKVTADSQLKMMPDLSGMMGAMGRGGAAPAGGAAPQRAMPDISSMLDHMPATKLDQLKPGSTVIVSSIKGAQAGQVTAIMLLANADMLLQMAAMQSGSGRGAAAGAAAMGMNGMGGGMDMGAMMGMGMGGIMQ